MVLKKVGYVRLLVFLWVTIYLGLLSGFYYNDYFLGELTSFNSVTSIVALCIFISTCWTLIAYIVMVKYTPSSGEYEYEYRNPLTVYSPANEVESGIFFLITGERNFVNEYFLYTISENGKKVYTYYQMDRVDVVSDFKNKEATITKTYRRPINNIIELPFRMVGYKLSVPYFTITLNQRKIV